MTGLKDKQPEPFIVKGEGSAATMEEEIKDEGACVCVCVCVLYLRGVKIYSFKMGNLRMSLGNHGMECSKWTLES